MQGQITRPTRADHIAYAGTPNEMWWSPDHDEWIKPPVVAPSLDRVIQAYDAIRTARQLAEAEHKRKDALLEADQATIRALILKLMNETGAKSVATDFGTAYRTEKVKASAADWGAVANWIAEDPSRFEIMEKRIKATFVKDYMDEHGGQIPPGINVHREYEVSVRRPTNK